MTPTTHAPAAIPPLAADERFAEALAEVCVGVAVAVEPVVDTPAKSLEPVGVDEAAMLVGVACQVTGSSFRMLTNGKATVLFLA